MQKSRIKNMLNSAGSNQAQARQELFFGLSSGKTDKPTLVKALAYVYLSCLIIAMIVWGPSLALYLSFAILAAVFILPNQHLLGLSLIISLTMVFERYFTLQGLAVDRTVYKFYLIDIIICLSWLALFINIKARQPKTSLPFGWPEKFMLAWLIIVAAYMARGLMDINADFAIVFSSFKNYFFYPLLYFFVVLSVDSAKKLKSTVHLMLFTAVGLIAFIFIGLINGQGLWTEFTPLSTAGTRYLAGTHAFYLALAVAISVPLFLYQRLRNRSFALAIMALWSLGIAVSLMRHLWLALFSGALAAFLLVNKELKKSFIVFISQAALIAAAVFGTLALAVSLLYFQGSMDKVYADLSALTSRVATVADLSADSSATWRQDVWHDAEVIWSANPIFGSGFGHIMLVDSGTYQSFEEIRNIHNSPLAIAVQMGLLGLLAFAAAIGSAIFCSFKSIYADEDLKPYYLGILSAIVVFLTASLFQPYLETNLMAIWLWLLLGLLRTSSLIHKNDILN